MRPGRSWSLGKNNVLSPLTDQVAPAPPPSSDGGRVLQEVARGPSGTEGKQSFHSLDTFHLHSPTLGPLYVVF